MPEVTIRRIAELANVSAATVSYVLNDRPGISQRTRDRVLAIVEQEGYVPDKSSKTAVVRRESNVYLVVDGEASLGDLFYSTILDTIAVAAQGHELRVVLCKVTDTFQSSAAAKAVRRGSVDGLIFLRDIDSETLLFLSQSEVSFVVIDSHRRDARYSRICADYDEACFTAATYLIELGHRAVGFIGEQAIPDFYISTFNGFCRALSSHRLTVHPTWIQSGACDADSAYRCMESILEFDERPTAVVCATDLFALAAMRCAQDHGLRIPDDISFTGIDDLYFSRLYFPALTTIRIDSFEMAEKAVECLSRQIENRRPGPHETVTLQSSRLIVRGSTASPPVR